MLRFETLVCPDPAPRNLVPAGLPDIIPGLAERDTTSSVFFRSRSGELFIEDFEPGAVADDPLGGMWPAIGASGLDADRAAPISLGPRVARSDHARCGVYAVAPPKVERADVSETEIGIIDAGIAFWNPAFRADSSGTNGRFASFGAMKLNDRQIVAEALTPAEIQKFYARSDAENRRELAGKYPESVFGDQARWPLVQPNGLAHGTAMAELVLTNAPKTARLHGLELPVSVVRDLTGGQMTAVMEIALLALIDQVRNARKQDGKPDKSGFRLVVLMAFGFTGGPMDGTSEALEGLQKTLTDYNANGFDIELVLPIGNQRQDQLHARLEPGQDVGWRILPDDHSANTVEVIHARENCGLTLAQPGGDPVDLPAAKGLYRIWLGDQPIGALWSEDLSPNKTRTRISITPTASSRIGVPVAPAGKWRLSCRQSAVQLWILRDETGFEDNPYQPARASWFEDRSYRRTDQIGMPALVDAPHRPGDPLSVVRRDGCASLLASSRHDKISVVTATLQDGQPAPYASLLPGGATTENAMSLSIPNPSGAQVDWQPLGPFGGRAVLGNGGPTRFRAAGTSLAAALKVGEIAGS